MPRGSSSSIPAKITTKTPLLEYRSNKIFQTELFDVYVARIVRKCIAQQFVSMDHPVLVDEQRMIDSVTSDLRGYLKHSVLEWKIPQRTAKMVVISHIRLMAEQRLDLHDFDDNETRDTALELIYKNDYEELFLGIWKDDHSS
jgi:hypothetical protein